MNPLPPRILSRMLLAVLAFSTCDASWPPPGQAVARAKQPVATRPNKICPFQTPEEWRLFLTHYADNEKWVETCEDDSCDSKYHEFVRTNIQGIFAKCAGFLDEHPAIARCTQNMRKFTPVWLRQHDATSYGFEASNHDYLSAQTMGDKPRDMMKIPDAIVAALPNRELVERVAREQGYRYLTHDSALGGVRTFIFVPDPEGRFDQWMLLNLGVGRKDIAVKSETPMSILAVQRKDEFGRELPRVRLHFRDYTLTPVPRERGKGQGFRLTLDESINGKCYSCHSGGVRQLIPRRTSTLQATPVKGEAPSDDADFAFKRLMEFNRKLRSYGAPDWSGMIDDRAIGPPLGHDQGCMDCHNGSSRAVLSVLTSHKQVAQKMIHELAMPPDTNLVELLERGELKNPVLSPEEAATLKEASGMHAALYRDFERARLPALKDWFLEVSCR